MIQYDKKRKFCQTRIQEIFYVQLVSILLIDFENFRYIYFCLVRHHIDYFSVFNQKVDLSFYNLNIPR